MASPEELMPKYAELRRLLRKEKHTQALTACAALRKQARSGR